MPLCWCSQHSPAHPPADRTPTATSCQRISKTALYYSSMSSCLPAGSGGRRDSSNTANQVTTKASPEEGSSPAGVPSDTIFVGATPVPAVGPWVLRQDHEGRYFWWNTRTGQCAYHHHYHHTYNAATAGAMMGTPPSSNGYAPPPHQPPYPVLLAQPSTGYPSPTSGHYPPVHQPWVTPPSAVEPVLGTMPVIVPVVPAATVTPPPVPTAKEGTKGREEVAEKGGVVGSTGARAKKTSSSSSGVTVTQDHDDNKKNPRNNPWVWEKFYDDNGTAVWIHAVTGKVVKEDPYR